jgi:hypothetical protein
MNALHLTYKSDEHEKASRVNIFDLPVRAWSQAVICQPVTVKTCARFQASSCNFYCGQAKLGQVPL